jgi:ABC-2 type transport system permease protein
MFGAATLQLPTSAQDISPFTHTPKLPGAELTALPVLGLIAIAVALVAVGLGSFRRRDLALPT